MTIRFTLNGDERSYDGDPEKPLLWVLREDMAMPGTKFGCGAGLCGACTVHLQGEAVRSCLTPLAAVEGQAVTTIEAIREQDAGKRIVAAWQELDVPQCGYCQAGQIMSASALLAADPSPDEAAIDAAMWGNLCRCSTYTRIREAIHKAAGMSRGEAA